MEQLKVNIQKKYSNVKKIDTLIAAHARKEVLILVTNNMREFERVPDLLLENWVA